MNDYLSVSFRIWRIRCTLLSRGDARCWRISTTPEAPLRLQSTSVSLPPSFLASYLCFFQRPSLGAVVLTPSFSFFTLAHFLLTLHLFSPLTPLMLQGHRMARLYVPFLFSSSPHSHVLASERHCGYTRCSFFRTDNEGVKVLPSFLLSI